MCTSKKISLTGFNMVTNYWPHCSYAYHRMEDETQHVIKQQQQQQQSTEDKTVLCNGIKLPVKEKMGAGKRELVVDTHKMAQLEESSELCICMIAPADKEMEEAIPEMVNTPHQQQQQQQLDKSELCTGCVDMIVAPFGISLVKLPTLLPV